MMFGFNRHIFKESLMKLSWVAGFVFIACLLFATGSRGADRRQVVAVFDIQVKYMKISKSKKKMLTEVMAEEVALGGVYQIMPPGDVKRTLNQHSANSYKKCFDEKCQIQLGRQLPANKLLTSTIKKIGGKCRVTGSLYDLKRQTTDTTAKAVSGCKDTQLVKSIEQVAAKLRAFGTGGSPDMSAGQASDWSTAVSEYIVQFDSQPSGAVVLVDGKMICKETPCSRSIPAGKHVVSMQAERHRERKQQLSIKEGSQVNWKLSPNFGWLSVSSIPSDLAITINERSAGKTPLTRDEREAGRYKIAIIDKCLLDTVTKTKVSQGQEQKVVLKPKPRLGAVKVKAKDPKGNDIRADVFAVNKRLGRTPGTFKVPICTTEIEVRHAKHGSAKKAISLRERKLTNVVLTLGGGGGAGTGTMVMIPAGDFWMGCNSKVDLDCGQDEKPGRKVSLEKFYLDKSEVTVAQYSKCVAAGRCKKPMTGRYYNWAVKGKENHPINGVDWNDAKTYCEWSGKHLPSEAQFEKASRGTDGKVFPWGNTKASCIYAAMKEGGDGCGNDRTWPVCSKKHGNSPYGLCDMSGNVWEWVQDWYSKDYYSKAPKKNPPGPKKGDVRTLRGGSWADFSTKLRSSYRHRYDPKYRYFTFGFRCAR
jgi:formylglycine-generating enzyme required for sulfatase activity